MSLCLLSVSPSMAVVVQVRIQDATTGLVSRIGVVDGRAARTGLEWTEPTRLWGHSEDPSHATAGLKL
jgi:hypothetical protein